MFWSRVGNSLKAANLAAGLLAFLALLLAMLVRRGGLWAAHMTRVATSWGTPCPAL